VHDGTTTPIENLLAAVRFDLALIAFWPNAERYLPVIRERSPATRVVVDSIDLHFLRNARRIFGDPAGDARSNLLDADYTSCLAGEINTYAAADAVLAVSQKEAGLVNDLLGEPAAAFALPD